MEKISRSGYFFGAVLLHLIVFILVATWVVFPEFHPPATDFSLHYLPPPPSPPSPPPPPPTDTTQPSVAISTPTPSTPVSPIVTPGEGQPFKLPVPKITSETAPVDVQQKMTQPVVSKPPGLSEKRLISILNFLKHSGRTLEDIRGSDGDPRRINAKFPVFVASYADGDWGCNVHMKDGKIDAGSLPDLIAKVNEWSHGHITGEVTPTPLDIGGHDLLDKQPPFIFFTGHKDFVLTDQEIQNLRDYLQIGGAIWGDNAEAGRGSRFDVAFRREMKRVVPDLDKNFEPVDVNDKSIGEKIFEHGWYSISKIPQGMNYYAEPLEHLDIDGEVAILYTPNDYSDMFFMRILPGDTEMLGVWPDLKSKSPLFTSPTFLYNRDVFFRNFKLPNCLSCDQLGMNVIGYLLVRFDKDLLLATP